MGTNNIVILAIECLLRPKTLGCCNSKDAKYLISNCRYAIGPMKIMEELSWTCFSSQQEISFLLFQEAYFFIRNCKDQLSAIAFTRVRINWDPLVGVSFAKACLCKKGNSLKFEVNHMQLIFFAHFIDAPHPKSSLFICLTVSGGHTQLFLVQIILDNDSDRRDFQDECCRRGFRTRLRNCWTS